MLADPEMKLKTKLEMTRIKKKIMIPQKDFLHNS